jgi:hypothetical protein
MEDKKLNQLLNEGRNELAELLNRIKSAPPSEEVVSFLTDTIEEMIDIGEQSYCHLRDKLMEFKSR